MNDKSRRNNHKGNKTIFVTLVIATIFFSYPCFFLIGSQICGYGLIDDGKMEGFYEPLAHIGTSDNSEYIFAYQYDDNHYLLVDDSDYIKSFKNTLIFFEIGTYTKDVEQYGEFVLYRDGETAEEMRFYPGVYAAPAQFRFNWFFLPVAKKLTVAEYEQYCIDNSLTPPYGLFKYLTR